MTLLRPDQFAVVDAAIDGVGYMLEHEEASPVAVQGSDTLVERQNVDTLLEQNHLDSLYWSGNRSWHEGQGQVRLDMPPRFAIDPTSASSPYKHLRSKGVDITTKGQLTLLKRTAKILSATNQDPAPQKLAVSDVQAWISVGQPNLKRFSALDASDVATVGTGTETSQETYDLASDGTQVYAALGADGIHRTGTATATQREAFDVTTGWSGTALAFTADATNKKEGAAALKITGDFYTSSNIASKALTGGPLDFSAVDQFRIWLMSTANSDAGATCQLRLQTSSGNYYSRNVTVVAGTWIEDVSSRSSWTAVGSPNWASIATLLILPPTITLPSFVAATSSGMGTCTTGSVTSVVGTLPSGATVGDVLIAAVGGFNISAGSTPTITAPSGWTLIQSTASSTQERLSTYYRVVGASEPTSYTWSFSASLDTAISITAWRNVDTASVVNISGSAASTSSGTAIAAPSVTTTLTDTTLLFVGMGIKSVTTANQSVTPPSGYAEVNEQNGCWVITEQAYKLLAAAGASGTASATTSGTVDRNHGHLIALGPKKGTLSADDFRSTSSVTLGHWSDWDARVLGWAKDRLYAAGIKSGTQWRFFEAASLATSAERSVLPDGWVVSDIAELAGIVYFSAWRGGKGVIYGYDGTNAPVVMCPTTAMGEGTIPLSLTPFSGAGMLVECRRLTGTASAGLGVLYRGFPDASGALRIERLAVLGADDGRDYGIRCGAAYGDYAYFGMNFGDEPPGENFLADQTKRSGLGIYWPETGAYGRSYLSERASACSGIVEDCAVFRGRRMFTVGGTGLFIEQTTYEPEGGVETSLMDINVSADKIWLVQESYYANPEAIASPVAHAYSLDGTTWVNDTTAGDTTVKRLRTSLASLSVRSPSIYARTRLLTTNQTTSPVLSFTGIGGWPANRPTLVFVLAIRAYPHQENRAGQRIEAFDNGWSVLNLLLGLWSNQTIVDYQPPWWSDSAVAYKARISDIQTSGAWGTSGACEGGLVIVKLKTVS